MNVRDDLQSVDKDLAAAIEQFKGSYDGDPLLARDPSGRLVLGDMLAARGLVLAALAQSPL